MNTVSFSAPSEQLAQAKAEEFFKLQRWQNIVTKRYINTIDNGDYFMILHATKGWKRLSKKRVGL